MSKPLSPLRRSELIAPFGVGAMVVIRNGTSLITAGLDHWYEREDGSKDSLDIQEYRVDEWRLQDALEVEYFRLPPDYRRKSRGVETPNTEITVPFLRFPRWHFCSYCRLLHEASLTSREREVCPECTAKESTKKTWKPPLRQVPFVAMCDQGHLQDFPWREWVHKTATPNCQQKLRLIATSGATLESQLVKCECGASRNLALITTAFPDGTTHLSKDLEVGGPAFTCRGKRPWLGLQEGESCTRPLRGSLRSAANLYFAQLRSAIYLPRGNDIAPSELVTLMEQPPLSSLIKLLKHLGEDITPVALREHHAALLKSYSDEQITAAIKIIISGADQPQDEFIPEDDSETRFRRSEFNTLRMGRDENILRARPVKISNYEPDIAEFFSKITLVEKLRVTTVFKGFSRIYSESSQSLDDFKRLLWREPPSSGKGWLPASIIFGEGIYLELDEQKVQDWQKTNEAALKARIGSLVERYKILQEDKHLRERPLGPRFLLLHTLSHLLMNRLTFECGYSSAALRERLYISNNSLAPMAGLLIYTAAGDSEGTLGGLVRMGKPGNLESVIQYALENAQWCSADPVCMELGVRGGQGPDSCNLAACHNCALVPETACEEFNRFLDRAVVIGDTQHPGIGFFENMLN
jgi:hypothetical protein